MIPLFITAILAGRRPTIFGDGSQSRDFTFVSDVVQGNLLAADAPATASGKVFNLANGRSSTLLDLIAAINQLLGLRIEPVLAPARVGDVRESLADISLARQFLGYEPGVSFEEGLKRSIDYYRAIAGQ